MTKMELIEEPGRLCEHVNTFVQYRTTHELGRGGRAALCLRGLVLALLVLKVLGGRFPVQARLAVQKGTLLDRAAAGALVLAVVGVVAVLDVVTVVGRRGYVGNLLGDGVLAADGGDADV